MTTYKEVDIFLLDVGPASGLSAAVEEEGSELTRLEVCRQYIQGRWIPQLVYPRKTYQTSLILFGTTCKGKRGTIVGGKGVTTDQN